MNQVVLIPHFLNSLSSLSEPTSPAKMPRVMSHGESWPPYEPSHPATASTSQPYATTISFVLRGALAFGLAFALVLLAALLLRVVPALPVALVLLTAALAIP